MSTYAEILIIALHLAEMNSDESDLEREPELRKSEEMIFRHAFV